MINHIHIPDHVHQADVIFLSHSGGKDSQATYLALKRMGLLHKTVIIHADLKEMEWEEMKPWIESTIDGQAVHVVHAEEDFFTMCLRTGRLPSSQMQYCTDILKIQPISKFIHDYLTAHGLTTAINCTGMRAEESPRRAKKGPFSLSQGEYTSGMHMPKKYPGHTIHDWLPLFDFTTQDVLSTIEAAGQAPHHVYSLGFSRLSCVFCVNGKVGEHKKAAELRPELALKFSNLERQLGKALRMKQIKNVKYPKYLDEYTDLPPAINLIDLTIKELA
jgi:DNA sulfur modification protein DndC